MSKILCNDMLPPVNELSGNSYLSLTVPSVCKQLFDRTKKKKNKKNMLFSTLSNRVIPLAMNLAHKEEEPKQRKSYDKENSTFSKVFL